MNEGEILQQILETLVRMDKRLEFLQQMQKALHHHHEAVHLRIATPAPGETMLPPFGIPGA